MQDEHNSVPAIQFRSADLDLDSKPPQIADGAYFTVGASEYNEDHFIWVDDRTVVTDNYTMAMSWAYVRLSMSADGENPMPIARILVHRGGPFEVVLGQEGEDEVAGYVTGEGIIERDDEGFERIATTVREWGAIVKVLEDDEC
jgi:hypothetical protein